jgi:lytic murein transglycosylase
MQMLRLAFVVFVTALAIALLVPTKPARAQSAEDFARFLAELKPQAAARGVSSETFDRAFAGVVAKPALLGMAGRQAEFARPLGEYLAAAVPPSRVAAGRAQASRWSGPLSQIERQTGVPSSVVLGVWGMETNYGTHIGGEYVIQALATLAAARYRGDFFKDELLAALRILEEGHVEPAAMRGSWAGAMGQTQFMPSTFLRDAVDFDGDGRKDIWSSVPDSLASTASFLRDHGWDSRVSWGYEAVLPTSYALTAAEQSTYAPFPEWERRGLRRADGEPLPAQGEAKLMLLAGLSGPAFLMTRNFEVIRAYNTSTAYALAVGLLADRIDGAAGFKGAWPTTRPLSPDKARQTQRTLTRLGYDVGAVDGKIGEKVRGAIRDWQERHGLTPDGEPTDALLQRLTADR